MRKVAWPKWPEVRRFSAIVLTTVIIYTAYVFGLDSLFGVLSGWLYDN
jgi:preprotein translocase subunit SecE